MRRSIDEVSTRLSLCHGAVRLRSRKCDTKSSPAASGTDTEGLRILKRAQALGPRLSRLSLMR